MSVDKNPQNDQFREPPVKMPSADAQERPVDWDIEEGHERMQGESRGRQDAAETEEVTEG